MSDNGCPYGAEECPKLDNLKLELDRVVKSLSTLTKLVYVMCGVMFCEFGVVLW